MKKHIPNTLTSLNLFCGCIAAMMAFQGNYSWALVWVVIAAIFDFSDGFAARLLKAYSPMGKELDSLADMVSFGFVPGLTAYRFLSEKLPIITQNELVLEYLPYFGFLITIFSGLRLAKFNIDERQTESFIGLNTPANTLFWMSFCCGLTSYSSGLLGVTPVVTPMLIYLFVIGILVFSLLLVSEIPMFSLKVKSPKFKGNEYRYFLAIFMVGMIVAIGPLGIAAGILLYITLSIMQQTKLIK